MRRGRRGEWIGAFRWAGGRWLIRSEISNINNKGVEVLLVTSGLLSSPSLLSLVGQLALNHLSHIDLV